MPDMSDTARQSNICQNNLFNISTCFNLCENIGLEKKKVLYSLKKTLPIDNGNRKEDKKHKKIQPKTATIFLSSDTLAYSARTRG